MKDISDTLVYKGVEYPLVFNINVLEEIQQEYGTFAKWLDLITGDVEERRTGETVEVETPTGEIVTVEKGEPDIKAIKFAYFQMINEGLDIENDEKGEKREPVTMRFIGRMFTEIGLDEMVKKLNTLALESNQSGETPKNG